MDRCLLGENTGLLHLQPDEKLSITKNGDVPPDKRDERWRLFRPFTGSAAKHRKQMGKRTGGLRNDMGLTANRHMATRASPSPTMQADPAPARNHGGRGLSAGLVERLVSLGVLAGVGAAIVLGWLHRHDSWINPEHGLGYGLGIAGATMMLILLGYPIRKRVRARRRAAGSVGFWFRFHMLLGLIGPLAILFHSRFTFGAVNSAVALGAMIVVASSGLIGRFLYSRVHRGYSDRKLEVRALKREMDEMLAAIESGGLPRREVIERLQTFEDCAVKAGDAFWSSASSVLGLSIRSRLAEWRLRRELRSAPPALRATLVHFFEALRRAGEFAFFDRLLRLWHLLHLPLFILLIAAVLLHIVAVHMY